MKLISRLVLGVIAGVLLGLFAPDPLVRVMLTLKENIGILINFFIPFIILLFITSGIASLTNHPGKVLGYTTLLAYGSSIFAGFMAMGAALFLSNFFSGHMGDTVISAISLKPYFILPISPVTDIFTSLILAFLSGVGIAATNALSLKKVVDEGRDIVEYMITNLLLPLLPLFIAGIFVEMVLEGAALKTLTSFTFVLLTAFTLHWVWLFILYGVAGLFGHKNPLTALKNMLPAYVTAVSTMSSAATIPVALTQTKKNIGNPSVANFTVPLCANIHLCGSMITITICSIAVMQISPQLANASVATMTPFIIILAMVMIAAPGVPGGAVMSAIGVLGSMLGFDSAAIGLMIALYVAQDSFGTACNVTGDGAIAMIIDRHYEKNEREN